MVGMGPAGISFKGKEKDFKLERNYDLQTRLYSNEEVVEKTANAIKKIKQDFLNNRESDGDKLKITIGTERDHITSHLTIAAQYEQKQQPPKIISPIKIINGLEDFVKSIDKILNDPFKGI